MGGRGSSSGISYKGHKYGTDYKTLLKDGNIKFVRKTSNNSETLMETMTNNRVYAQINNRNNVSSIIYFDKNNKRSKQIDLLHKHNGISPHVHHGYWHNENDSSKGASNLTSKEKKLVDRILKKWYNYNNK